MRIIFLCIGIILFVVAFGIGGTSIYTSRLIRDRAVPTRYAQFAASDDTDRLHLHDVHVRRPFLGGELHAYSDQQSYVRLWRLWIPVSSREWLGWLFTGTSAVLLGGLFIATWSYWARDQARDTIE
jgi:hypothetical protein